MSPVPYIARLIDTETGAFTPTTGALIEIGWGYLTPDLRVERSDSIYILPQEGKVVEPGAAEINGYTPELWEEYGAVPLEVAIAKIQAEWAQHPPMAYAGANCPFDHRFIGAYAPQLGTYNDDGTGTKVFKSPYFTDEVIDTQKFGRQLWNREGVTKPPKGGLSVTGLLVKLGATRLAGEAHGALEDVIATGQLLRLLRNEKIW